MVVVVVMFIGMMVRAWTLLRLLVGSMVRGMSMLVDVVIECGHEIAEF